MESFTCGSRGFNAFFNLLIYLLSVFSFNRVQYIAFHCKGGYDFPTGLFCKFLIGLNKIKKKWLWRHKLNLSVRLVTEKSEENEEKYRERMKLIL